MSLDTSDVEELKLPGTLRNQSTKFSNENTNVRTSSIRQGEEAYMYIVISNNRIPYKEDIKWGKNEHCEYDYTKVEIPDSYNIIMLLSYNDLLGNIFTQKLRFDVKHGLRRSMIAVEKMSVIFV